MNTNRVADVRLGVRIEVISLAWMVVEMVVSIGAGIAAGSVLLAAFGVDSLLEIISGAVLLWRLWVEARGGDLELVEKTEHRATWIVAVTLALLSIYVLVTAVLSLLTQSKPESSPLGIAVSAAALLFMPYLAFTKRRIARRIGSDALAGDAAESITCAYMAATVLGGLLLNALFGWWWIEDVAALLFLVWLVRETWETFEEALHPE